MVDFIQRYDRGKLFVHESFDDLLYSSFAPCFQWLFEGETIKDARDYLTCTAVTGELALKRLDCCCFCLTCQGDLKIAGSCDGRLTDGDMATP